MVLTFSEIRDLIDDFIIKVKLYIDEICEMILGYTNEQIAKILKLIDENIIFYINDFKTKTFKVFDDIILNFEVAKKKIKEFLDEILNLKTMAKNALNIIAISSRTAVIKIETANIYMANIERLLKENNLNTDDISNLKSKLNFISNSLREIENDCNGISTDIERHYQNEISSRYNEVTAKLDIIPNFLNEKKVELEEKYDEYVTQNRKKIEEELNEIPNKIKTDFCGD